MKTSLGKPTEHEQKLKTATESKRAAEAKLQQVEKIRKGSPKIYGALGKKTNK